jgi:hypothetical protein
MADRRRKQRDPASEQLELVGVRLPTALVVKLDERARALSRELGVRVQRADVVRRILSLALATPPAVGP